MNEEQHGHDPRLGVRIIVGPSKRSNPRGVVAQMLESPCLLAREISNGGTTVPSICTQARVHRRIAEQAAAPNARYYGHEDPIVGMPCAQAIGGHPRVRSPPLGLSTILETDAVRIVLARMHDGRSVKCAHSGENMAAHILYILYPHG